MELNDLWMLQNVWTWLREFYFSHPVLSPIIVLVVIFVIGCFYFWVRLFFRKKRLSPTGAKWKKIEEEIQQLQNPTPDSIRAMIAATAAPDTFLQARYYAHISHFVLWGLLGTIVGLFLSLQNMRAVFSNVVDIETLVHQFRTLLPNMSLAFVSTISGIILSMLGRWLYYRVDLSLSLETLENSLIQEVVSKQKPSSAIFEEFVEVFTSRFREEFLHEFSETVRHGFNEGVKEFGQSIQQMGSSITGTMDRLSDIGDHLSSFTSAFKRAGNTITAMDHVVQGLNVNLQESASVLHEATDLLSKQVLQFGDITENTGKIEKVMTSLEKRLVETTESQKGLATALNQQEKWAQNIEQALGSNNESMTDLANSLSSILETGQHMTTAVSDLNEGQRDLTLHLEKLAVEVKLLSSETTGYRGLLESISEREVKSEDVLVSINDAIHQMGNRHQSLMNLQGELLNASKGISKDFSVAAAAMNQWGKLQGNALDRLESLSNKLTNADDKQLEAYELFISSFEHVKEELMPAIRNFSDNVKKFKASIDEMGRKLPDKIANDLNNLAQALRNIQQDLKNSGQNSISLQEEIGTVFKELHAELLSVLRQGSRDELHSRK